jgi:hypothetical protein
MADVGAVFAAILKNEDASLSLCHYSANYPNVDCVLVFRLYDSNRNMAMFLKSIDAALTVMAELDKDAHVINETLNFTGAYDGARTGTGEQRDTLMDQIDEKLQCGTVLVHSSALNRIQCGTVLVL